ncbi:hypothetical protein FCU94_03410 [Vibrio sp. JPW-9-11-11]|uniref:hypothetical protein n=1 Tax=Vibrio sp. JPW-9-11-11 TaxID=1416532 RepID=UPI001593D1B8|nr:hypothetical protein [Vibrio sp. JPW-9-11-11]NVD05955.1 hypothetical protein [Vibrio sp. JPW-9-11-11]
MRYLFGLLMLFSSSLSAQSVWLATEPSAMRRSIVSSWSECPEQRWCQDMVTYYQELLYAQAELTPHRLEVVLIGEFTSHRLSQLQLNLRRDGFELVKVEFGQQVFDVAEALQTMPAVEVDKALIVFINQYRQSTQRVLTWHASFGRALLHSDGELITLQFDYSQ